MRPPSLLRPPPPPQMCLKKLSPLTGFNYRGFTVCGRFAFSFG